MAPLLFKEMKRVNFSCASPASAAVCTSIDRRSMVRPTIIGKPSIDCHMSQSRRTKALGQLPKPAPKSKKSLDHRPSTRTSTSTRDETSPVNSSRYLLDDTAFFDVYPEFEPSLSLELLDKKPNASVSSSTDYPSSSSSIASSPRILKPVKENKSSSTVVVRRSPVSWAQSLVPSPSPKLQKSSSPSVLRPSNPIRSHHDQVVVLRVSLHCKGCEGKVRKHISKMEGVTSFNIDFAAKKVTVKGDVTPLGVLNSVSKVKNAQFWPSPPRASASF